MAHSTHFEAASSDMEVTMMRRWLATALLILAIFPARRADAASLFVDTFESGDISRWTPVGGAWTVCQPATASGSRLCQTDPAFTPPLLLTGDNGWADYAVQATVNLADDAKGRVGVLGRVQDKYHFYELRLEKNSAGVKCWWIYKSVSNTFTMIASGPFEYVHGVDYVLRLTLTGSTLAASVSTDAGATFKTLGSATDTQYRVGRIGLKTKSTAASFDNVTVTSAGSTPPNTRRFGHVVLITLENHSADQVLGSPYLPYFNELAAQYGLAVNYYANAHPSAPNYFAWTTGLLFNQTTPLPAGTPNIVRSLQIGSRSWRAYFDEFDSTANVFPYLPEVAANGSQRVKIQPITPNFVDAVNNNVLPHFSLVHPRYADNGHACRGAQPCLMVTDNWLRAYVAPYIATPAFAVNHDLLILAWDEGDLLDNTCGPGPTTILMSAEARAAGAWTCGGRTVFVLIGVDVKPGYVSTTIFHDEAVLRLALEGLGVTKNLPGAAAFAPNMNEFFK